MTLYRQKKLAIVLALVCLVSACGGSLSIQSVLKGGDTLVDFAVSKGRISAVQGEHIKTDFHDTLTCAEALDSALDQIAKDDPEAKKKKLNAWVTAGRCWKPIILRQNFAADSQVQRVAQIIDGIFAAGIVFYSESGAMRADAEGRIPTDVKDDRVLEADLEKRLKELEKAMKP